MSSYVSMRFEIPSVDAATFRSRNSSNPGPNGTVKVVQKTYASRAIPPIFQLR